MQVIKTVKEMQRTADMLRGENKVIGFVPTMGFLHEGHLSLIRKAREKADKVVVSIFVNPTQFGPNEDLDNYPRDFVRDSKLCEDEGVDYLFFPATEEMYPSPFFTSVTVDVLTNALCGLSRPGHFSGVATVVTKLFNIVKPHFSVFGQKDFQQVGVIKAMTGDLNIDTEIVVAPIVREPDGLAMSSRNKYLNPVERKNAPVLHESLQLAREMVKNGELNVLNIKKAMEQKISSVPSEIDYISIVNGTDFKPVTEISDNTLFALAVKIGKTRLIDNFYIPTLSKEETWQ